MKTYWVALALAALCATTARAGWETVAEVTAGGAAKELAVDRALRTVQIECTEGTVIVNTVTIREGEAKNPVSVGKAFAKGETRNIDLGYERPVTGLRISDGGQGRYKVNVQ
jgi:hypothetical protein